jgi:glycosyltransferase involved in cell wall biosynthesis
MLQMTPVLITYGGGHSEIITHGVTGYLYTYGNVNDFIEQCSRYLRDEVERNMITKNAYNHARSTYSSTQHTKKILRIYRKLQLR